MPTAKSKKKLVPLFIAICFALIILPLAGVYIYLKNNSDALLRNYLKKVQQETGQEIHFENLDVIFFPLPALAISNAEVKSSVSAFRVGWMLVRPSFKELLHGNLAPAKIVLLRPRLETALPFPVYDPDNKAWPGNLLKNNSENGSATEKILPFIRQGCAVVLKQGEITLTGSLGAKINLAGVDCELDADAEEISGAFNFVTLNMRKNDKFLFGIERCALSGMSSIWNPLSDSRLDAKFQVRMPGIIGHSNFSLVFEGSPTGWNADINLKGDLDLGKAFVPLAISGRLISLADSGEIAIRGFEMMLDADSGQLNAGLVIPSRTRGFELSGTLQITRLSLTQWLGFARNLMPGLALALDNITDGSLDFILTSSGLIVPRIRACASGSCFRGTGSVKSFAKPNVFLDLQTDMVDLGDAIPEAVGEFPDPPRYFHDTLTPMPGKPTLPGEIGIDYDINLGAKKVTYGPLKLANGKVKITQGKMDRSGLEDVLIYGSGQGYGGTMKGLCILGAAKYLPMAITASARAIDAGRLSKDLTVLPVRSGILEADADVRSSGKKLDVFLGNLRGEITASGKNTVLGFGGKSFGPESLSLSTNIRRASFRQKSLGLDAKWQARLDGAQLDGSIDLDGLLWFGGPSKSVAFQNVPGKIAMKLDEKTSHVKGGLKTNVNGNFSAKANQLEIKKANVSALGATITGNLDINYGNNPGWRGNLKTNITNLSQLLQKIAGKKHDLPAKLRNFIIESDFSGKPDVLALSNIKSRLGAISINGKLSIDYAKKTPAFTFDLSTDKVDLAQLEGGNSSNPKNAKWDLELLKTFNAKGKIEIADLSVYNMRFRKCSMPLTLENGKLLAGPGSSVFYGANLHLRLKADFSKGINFGSNIEVLAFDLGHVARDHKVKSALTGLGSLTADIGGHITGPGQMPGALGGKWNIRIKNGSWQKMDSQGKLLGKPTMITLAQASGTLNRGVAKTDDFYMQNNTLKVNGGGWVNLANHKIDCNFNIDMKGLPNFPLHLYGTFDKPQTSIGAGKMVLNAIGGITGGIADIFGGIIQGTLNIFR